ncbi:O-methyltransferase-domain-containing protein [Daedaleopsis nitida]|nr:O-methyltransferase-domain-containing protein [Daedaleopsis nitida]
MLPHHDGQYPLISLLSSLTASIHAIEEELKSAGMPPFTLHPRWHPLDSLDIVPSPRLHEARRVAMASANMIKTLVQDVGTAMMDMASRSLDQAAYILTADIRLLDVYRTDQERLDGLHITEMVARLPKTKRVDGQKLARCLRLLSTDHWWVEPSPNVFAPLRWALLNIPDSPTWAYADPGSATILVASTAVVSHMKVQVQTHFDCDTVETAPFVRAIHAMGNQHIRDYWGYLEEDPDRLARFARSMEGTGHCDYSAIKADYPWESLPLDTTFVDVGSGQGSVALHILRMLYDTRPKWTVVLQDRSGPLEEGKRFWARELPAALVDKRVEFEPHDFFAHNPRKGPHTVYWLRAVLHDWSNEYAIKILKAIRISCHPTSRGVYLCPILSGT